jgi:hypothetical protein
VMSQLHYAPFPDTPQSRKHVMQYRCSSDVRHVTK